MNHRSHTDYIIVAYMATNRATLSYTVGEWVRTWPLLQSLIKSLDGSSCVENPTILSTAEYWLPTFRWRRPVVSCRRSTPRISLPATGISKSQGSVSSTTCSRRSTPRANGISCSSRRVSITIERWKIAPWSANSTRGPFHVAGRILSPFLRFLGHNVRLLLEQRWYRLVMSVSILERRLPCGHTPNAPRSIFAFWT